MVRDRQRFSFVVLLLVLLAAFTTGCGTRGASSADVGAIFTAPSHGSVRGGQQPVSGASIQLYAVGTGGDGTAATPLITHTPATDVPGQAITDSNGGFSITGLYACPNPSSLVYIVSTGGNPGLATGTQNTALTMMTALGNCGALTPTTYIAINELTTVAAVNALYSYMTSPSQTASATTDSTALLGAFTTAMDMVDPSKGTTPGSILPTGVTVPTAELNTLANIASACVNSAGGRAGDSTACGNLFTDTTPSGGQPPTDVITALIFIAKNPTFETASLYAMSSAAAPFQPQLTAAPANFNVISQVLGSIYPLGIPTATQVGEALGFNITPGNDWEFNLAQQAGSTEVRFQCGWGAVELTKGKYSTANCATALAESVKYVQRPLVVAAYGPETTTVATMTLLTAATASTSTNKVYNLRVTAPSFPTCANYGCEVLVPNNSTLEYMTTPGTWAYGGSLVASLTPDSDTSDNATLTLASALTENLPVGTKLSINQLLYPPAASDATTDPSVIAFSGQVGANPSCSNFPVSGGYAPFLACQIYNATAGTSLNGTGRVEIWNEPPWEHDPWDQAWRFFDVLPSNIHTNVVQDGFAAVLQTQTPPGNVRYVSGETDKSGGSSIFSTRMVTPTPAQTAASLAAEAFHPYGNNPEDNAWDATCLSLPSTTVNNVLNCYLPGTPPGGNMRLAIFEKQQHPQYQFEDVITETGTATLANPSGTVPTQLQKARFNLRQFIGFTALGMAHVNFYRLADAGAEFGFVDSNTQTPVAAYTSMSNLMAKVNGIRSTGTPTYTKNDLPIVTAYTGQYPLVTAQIVGTTTSTVANNSILFTCWQLSTSPTNWPGLASPAPGVVQVQLLSGMTPTSVTNLNTASTFRPEFIYNAATGMLTITVEDDPIAVSISR
jgi:hypothetical protein